MHTLKPGKWTDLFHQHHWKVIQERTDFGLSAYDCLITKQTLECETCGMIVESLA